MEIEIDIKQLEIVFYKIILKLKEDGVDRVGLTQDMYWTFSNKDSHDLKCKFESPLLGSLAEDWEALKKVSEDRQITTYLDFERLASILRAMSEELDPEA